MTMRRASPPAAAPPRSLRVPPVPPWLEPLLNTRFFVTCASHADAPRSESNMFCLECESSPAAFCYYCRSDAHSGHRVIQIRRSSYHDVVRVAEVEDVLDIGGVQTYVINSARVLFLNERLQPRGAGAAAGKAAASPYSCEICGRALLDHFRFCSLGCKLSHLKRHGDGTFIPGGAGGDGDGSTSAAATTTRRAPHVRRRKGIPHRAPFGS